MDKKEFGKRLRHLRKTNTNFTMKEFGSKFNLAESTISGYENGSRMPDAEIINKFADFFEVSTDYLLGRVDDPQSSLSVSFSHGGEELTPDEEEHLEAELKRYRELKARFMREKNKE